MSFVRAIGIETAYLRISEHRITTKVMFGYFFIMLDKLAFATIEALQPHAGSLAYNAGIDRMEILI
jgi:hypothetical protein